MIPLGCETNGRSCTLHYTAGIKRYEWMAQHFITNEYERMVLSMSYERRVTGQLKCIFLGQGLLDKNCCVEGLISLSFLTLTLDITLNDLLLV